MTNDAALLDDPQQFSRFMRDTRPISLEGIDWDAIRDHPLPDDVLRVLAYMQDVESHTVVFPRTFFSRRALEDRYVGPTTHADSAHIRKSNVPSLGADVWPSSDEMRNSLKLFSDSVWYARPIRSPPRIRLLDELTREFGRLDA